MAIPETPKFDLSRWLLKFISTTCSQKQLAIFDKSIKRLIHSIPPIFVILSLYYFKQLPRVDYTVPTLYSTFTTVLGLTFKFHSDERVKLSTWSLRSGIEKPILVKNERLLVWMINWNVSMGELQSFLKSL
jgi:hypothetical protein